MKLRGMTLKNHWKNFITIAVLMAVIISLFFLFHLLSNNTNLIDYSYHSSSNNWSVYTQKGEAATPLKPLQNEKFQLSGLDYPGQTFYMSRVMTNSGNSPILTFNHSQYHITVFLDGRPLYSDVPDLDYRIGHLEFPPLSPTTQYRMEPVYLSLPDDYVNKTLTLALQFMPFDEVTLNINTPPVYVYPDMSALWNESYTFASRIAFPSGALAAVGICLVLLYLLQMHRGQTSISVLMLAAMAFLWMGYFCAMLIRGSLPEQYSTLLNWNFYNLSYVPLFAFLALHMKKFKKHYLPFVWAYFVFITVVSIWWSFVGMPPNDILNLSFPLCSVAFGAAVFFAVLEWRQNNSFFRQLFQWTYAGALIIMSGYFISLATDGSFSNSVNYGIRGMFLFHNLTFLKDALALFLLIASYGISLIRFIRESVQKDVDIQSLELQSRFAEQSAAQMREGISDVREIKHEMAHHIESMKALFFEQDYSRLGQYLDTLGQHNKDIEPFFYCENYLINAIVSTRFKKAYAQRIAVQHWLYAPDKLNISDADLSSFLMNALDNAIEAAQAVADTEPRWIKLKITLNNEALFISCENSMAGIIKTNEEGQILTSKDDTTGHGFGIFNMKRIAEKYNSILIIDHTQNSFCIKTNLQIPKSK